MILKTSVSIFSGGFSRSISPSFLQVFGIVLPSWLISATQNGHSIMIGICSSKLVKSEGDQV